MVNGSSSILLENIEVTKSGPTLRVNGTTKLLSSLMGKTYVQGHVYRNNNSHLAVSNGTYLPYTSRGNLVDDSGRYFIKSQPQYADYAVSAFVSVKDVGATGINFYTCSIIEIQHSNIFQVTARQMILLRSKQR